MAMIKSQCGAGPALRYNAPSGQKNSRRDQPALAGFVKEEARRFIAARAVG